LDAVERLKRKDEFAKAVKRQRLDENDRKFVDFGTSKLRAYEDRMRLKQEMHLQSEVLLSYCPKCIPLLSGKVHGLLNRVFGNSSFKQRLKLFAKRKSGILRAD